MQEFGKAKPAPGAFFDTDFSTIDSVLALGMLHGLQGKNECRVEIVTMCRPNLAVAGFADTVERFYRGPAGNFAQVPPIGMRTVGAPGETSPAFTAPFLRKKADGTPVYKNEVKTVIQTGDPNTLFRNYLEAQYDQSSFCVLGGPATNLAAALEFPGLRDLVAVKVKHLVVAGAEAFLKADVPAARKMLAAWPTPVIVAGNEIGLALQFPGASIDKEFAATSPDHPIADAYRAYRAMPYDAPSWSLAALLYAARPGWGYFKVSEPGTIAVHDDGRIAFTASDKGKHQVLSLDPARKEQILAAYVELASAKPVIRLRFRPDAVDDQKKADDPEKP